MCMRVWITHVDLDEERDDHEAHEHDARLVDTLLYLSCRYHAEHWEHLRGAWQALSGARRGAVLYIVERLLSGAGAPLLPLLLGVLKRIVDALAAAAPAIVVGVVLSEVSAHNAGGSYHRAPRRASQPLTAAALRVPDAETLRRALDGEAQKYVDIVVCCY
jgi:hypothetical protein